MNVTCLPLQVLDIECCNVKALYRRAQAYMEAADLDLAKLDIQKALEADPQNRWGGIQIYACEIFALFCSIINLLNVNIKWLQGG